MRPIGGDRQACRDRTRSGRCLAVDAITNIKAARMALRIDYRRFREIA
jgi:hypothetical protein